MVNWPSNPTNGQVHAEAGQSWTFVTPPGVWSLTEADTDAEYLRLDATNDPLTGPLTLAAEYRALAFPSRETPVGDDAAITRATGNPNLVVNYPATGNAAQITPDGAVLVGSTTGSSGGGENMVKPGASSAFLNLKGGAGRGKVVIGNDSVTIASGEGANGTLTEANIRFSTTSGETDVGPVVARVDYAPNETVPPSGHSLLTRNMGDARYATPEVLRRRYVDVMDYYTGDDPYGEVQAALDDGAGREIVFTVPYGSTGQTYQFLDTVERPFASLILPTKHRIIGEPGAVLNYESLSTVGVTYNRIYLNAEGVFGTAQAVTAAANAGSRTITLGLSASTALADAKVAYIGSDDYFTTEDGSSGKQGEWIAIEGVETTVDATILTLATALRADYVTNPLVYPDSDLVDSVIEGLEIVGPGLPDDYATPGLSNGDRAIRVENAINATMRGNKLLEVSQHSLMMLNTYNGHIMHNKVQQTSTDDANFNQYPITVLGGSENVVIDANDVIGGKEGICHTVGTTPLGVTRDLKITNNRIRGTYRSGFATHDTLDALTIIGNTFDDCNIGADIRTRNGVFSNNHIKNTPAGGYAKVGVMLGAGFGNVVFNNNYYENVRYGISSATSVSEDGSVEPGQPVGDILIDGDVIRGTATHTAVWFRSQADQAGATFGNLTIKNIDYLMTTDAAINPQVVLIEDGSWESIYVSGKVDTPGLNAFKNLNRIVNVANSHTGPAASATIDVEYDPVLFPTPIEVSDPSTIVRNLRVETHDEYTINGELSAPSIVAGGITSTGIMWGQGGLNVENGVNPTPVDPAQTDPSAPSLGTLQLSGDGTTPGAGNLGTGISFGGVGTARRVALIASYQDNDVTANEQGLHFYTSPNADPVDETVVLAGSMTPDGSLDWTGNTVRGTINHTSSYTRWYNFSSDYGGDASNARMYYREHADSDPLTPLHELVLDARDDTDATVPVNISMYSNSGYTGDKYHVLNYFKGDARYLGLDGGTMTGRLIVNTGTLDRAILAQTDLAFDPGNAEKTATMSLRCNAAGGEGNNCAGLIFTRPNNNNPNAAIASYQTSTSLNQGGLRFFTDASSATDETVILAMQLDNKGVLSLPKSAAAITVGSGAGTIGGDDNLITTGTTNGFLNLKGGAGRGKVSIANDTVNIACGTTGTIRFGVAAAETDVGATGAAIDYGAGATAAASADSLLTSRMGDATYTTISAMQALVSVLQSAGTLTASQAQQIEDMLS